jgi:hypothetical protein
MKLGLLLSLGSKFTEVILILLANVKRSESAKDKWDKALEKLANTVFAKEKLPELTAEANENEIVPEQASDIPASCNFTVPDPVYFPIPKITRLVQTTKDIASLMTTIFKYKVWTGSMKVDINPAIRGAWGRLVSECSIH